MTLRKRIEQLEKENKELWKYLIKRCDATEYKANNAVLSVDKVNDIEERIEILEIIQKENQRDLLNLAKKVKEAK